MPQCFPVMGQERDVSLRLHDKFPKTAQPPAKLNIVSFFL